MYMGTYNRLRGIHVGSSNRDVIRATLRKLKKGARYARKYREQRHALLRHVLEAHASAQTLCRAFRL